VSNQPVTDLLTTAQVAALLNVTPATVTNWARRGQLAAVVLPGGHRRYHRADIEALLTPGAAVSA